MSDYGITSRRAQAEKWRRYNQREKQNKVQWIIGVLTGAFVLATIAAQVYLRFR